MPYYAWSHIRHHDGDKLQVTKPGSEVDAGSLGMEDDAFQELVDSGSVREERWPKGLSVDNPSGPSPNQYRLQQLRARRERLESEVNESGDAKSSEKPAAQ